MIHEEMIQKCLDLDILKDISDRKQTKHGAVRVLVRGDFAAILVCVKAGFLILPICRLKTIQTTQSPLLDIAIRGTKNNPTMKIQFMKLFSGISHYCHIKIMPLTLWLHGGAVCSTVQFVAMLPCISGFSAQCLLVLPVHA